MADNRGTFIASGENAIEWFTGSDRATVTLSSRRHINRIRKLAAAHPEAVKILAEPESNSGYLYASIPASWIRFAAPTQREYTEEQKQELADRARNNFHSDKLS